MTQNYTGMKKGISLVEMVIAIILFATLATITLKYTKSYLDTDIQAKKARVAALIEQAAQLVQAHQIYKVDMGEDADVIGDLNGTLTSLPTIITEIGTANWAENNATAITNHPTAFTFNITDAASDTKGEQYCALFNHEFNKSIDINVTDAQLFFTGADVAAAYAASGNKPNFCWSSAAQTHQVVILAY